MKQNYKISLKKQRFTPKATNPTKTFQTQIRSTIKQNPTLIDKDHRWKYANMNPSASSIKGLIKIHKPDQPIRPIMNSDSRVRQLINQIIVYKDTTGMMNHMNAYIVDWTGLVDAIKIE